MNERTLELAKQAGLKVESFMTNPPKPFQILGSTEQFEKFAELIVEECIDIVDTQWEPVLVEKIREHFGVEE